MPKILLIFEEFMKNILPYLKTKKTLLLVGFLILSRVFTFFISYNSYNNHFQNEPPISLVNFIQVFGKRWDGNSNTFVAKEGYVTTLPESTFIVFPPLYPLLIKIVENLIGDFVLSGVIISNIFFVLAAIMFYKLLKLDFSKNVSIAVVVLIAIFPTSYFFSVAYPESLLFLLITITLYLLRKNKLFLAVIVAGLASLTKPFGLALWIPVALQVFLNTNLKKAIVYMLILSSFWAIYLGLNKQVYGDYFAFSKFLSSNWHKTPAPFWKGIASQWRWVLGNNKINKEVVIHGIFESVASTTAIVFSILSFTKKYKLHITYSLYFLFSAILFTSTSYILSAPRYLISIPPFFIILAKLLKNKYAKTLWIAVSILALIALASEFAIGHWAY